MGCLVKCHLPKILHGKAGNHRRWVEAISIILFLSHNWSLKQKKGGVRKILVTSPSKCWLRTCSGSVIDTLLESEFISKPTRYAEDKLRKGNKCVNEFHSVSTWCREVPKCVPNVSACLLFRQGISRFFDDAHKQLCFTLKNKCTAWLTNDSAEYISLFHRMMSPCFYNTVYYVRYGY